jgi:hypothetical protein
MDTAAAKYSAITCPCGYAILMTTAQGDPIRYRDRYPLIQASPEA